MSLRTEPAFPYALLLALRAAVWLLFGVALVLTGRLLRRRLRHRLSVVVRIVLGAGWAFAAVACLGLEAVGVGSWVLGGHHLTRFGYWTLPVMALQAVAAAVASFVLWWFASRSAETVQASGVR